MGRISRPLMFMGMARIAAQRATCFRLNVGALVVHDNNPIAVGYNGQDPGADHCKGNDCPGIIPGRCGTIHAEVNALVKASTLLGDRMDTGEVDLYSTHSPCVFCTQFIWEDTPLMVKRIFFEVPYRDTSHLGMFSVPNPEFGNTVEVYEVTPAGYIVDYFTRRLVEFS